MSVKELLNAATGDKPKMLYICSKGCYYQLNEQGTDVLMLDGEPEDKTGLLMAMAIIRTDHGFGALLVDGANYKFCIWNGKGSTPVFEQFVEHQPKEAGEEEIELEALCQNDKFLGIGTFIMAGDDLYGSSCYYQWDGEKYNHVTGSLDDWYAAETDQEMVISADGQSLEQKPKY